MIVVLLILAIGGWIVWKTWSVPTYELITEKPVYGNASSPIVVLEFSDLQCPACKSANPSLSRIKKEFKGQIQFKYMHFPLSNLHQYAQKASEAAECANDAGKFFEYIDAAFAVSPDLRRSELILVAESLGIPQSNFTACLDSGWKSNFVAMDAREGERMGVQGTPTIFVNGKQAKDWEYLTLSTMIEDALKG